MSQLGQITRPGNQVKFEWECEFDETDLMNQKPEQLTHPIVKYSPLHTRDAMPWVSIIRYEKWDYSVCRHYDLYPYICKYFKFPIGHSVIQLGDPCNYKEACFRTDGELKCSFVPPVGLYQSVPSFDTRRSSCCLSRSCVLDHKISGQCTHTAGMCGL